MIELLTKTQTAAGWYIKGHQLSLATHSTDFDTLTLTTRGQLAERITALAFNTSGVILSQKINLLWPFEKNTSPQLPQS
ncbi:hypothetical protein CRENBAI_004263 [Crenichthys baileyi]|uniref:Uncharacterized protein n=1 Tax=Crenichthys baileyi TaxID=28760 RepID=A0AAV9RZ29_9TELE